MTPDRLIGDTDWLSRQLRQLSNPAYSGMIHVEEHFVLNIYGSADLAQVQPLTIYRKITMNMDLLEKELRHNKKNMPLPEQGGSEVYCPATSTTETIALNSAVYMGDVDGKCSLREILPVNASHPTAF